MVSTPSQRGAAGLDVLRKKLHVKRKEQLQEQFEHVSGDDHYNEQLDTSENYENFKKANGGLDGNTITKSEWVDYQLKLAEVELSHDDTHVYLDKANDFRFDYPPQESKPGSYVTDMYDYVLKVVSETPDPTYGEYQVNDPFLVPDPKLCGKVIHKILRGCRKDGLVTWSDSTITKYLPPEARNYGMHLLGKASSAVRTVTNPNRKRCIRKEHWDGNKRCANPYCKRILPFKHRNRKTCNAACKQTLYRFNKTS